MRSKTLLVLSLVAVLALVVAGCGSKSSSTTTTPTPSAPATSPATGASTATSSSGSGETIDLAADPSGNLKYDKTKLSAKAGDVTIAFTNMSTTPHDVVVTNSAGKKLGGFSPISKSNTKLNLKGLKAGTYTYFCDVPGHEAAGMKGTLTVK